MSWEGWFTCALVALLIVALIRNVASPDALMLGAATVLSGMRVFSDAFPPPREVASALGNQGLVTVAVLFVVAAGLAYSGGSTQIGAPVLGRPKSTAEAQIRMMVPVALISAFLNNTTVVAMFLPVVKEWARANKLRVGQLMMPLSFAAVLGGVCTLIGTSTNIVVQGLMIDAHMPAMSMFTLTPIGVTLAIIGVLYVIITSPRLLPAKEVAGDRDANPKQYTVEMQVERASPLAGQTIARAGLRSLPGLFLAQVSRGDEVFPAIDPEFTLVEGDRLTFAGRVESVADLTNMRGLVPVSDPEGLELTEPRNDRIFCEAVVSRTSPMIGKSIRDARFRSRYRAAVLAVHREGERIEGKIGDIILEPGDTLLLEGPPRFLEEQRDQRDFFLIAELAGKAPVRHERAWLSIAILAGLVVAGGLEPITHLDVLPFALLAATLMVLTGCCTMDQARKSIEWNVLFTIAGALVVARALESTGAAATLAEGVIAVARPLGTVGALAAVYLATLAMTELLTNNAAAALSFPLAVATAHQLEVSAFPFAITVCIAASCGFATPTGYQTHLMVFGAGGYRFGDFVRMGLGLDLVCFVVTILLVPLLFPF